MMRVIQFFGLALLFSSLFQDWGGFGESLINRALKLQSSTDIAEALLVLAIFLCTLAFVLVNKTSKEFKILKTVTTLVFFILISLFAWVAYVFSNFMSRGNQHFDGAALASLALLVLVITFFFDLRKNEADYEKKMSKKTRKDLKHP